jgi:hypothetical protein
MRTAGQINVGSVMPAPGKYTCVVIGIEKGLSKERKTPFVQPTFTDGEYEFNDSLYVTPNTIGRLCMFAKRVCLMPDDFELPDGDTEAARVLAKFIMENALNKKCIVVVEEQEEKFMPTTGEDAGRTITKKRRRIAFNGYKKYEEQTRQEDNNEPPLDDDDLPF